MTDAEFRAFMDLLMCSDPWPVPDQGYGDGAKQLAELADREAHKRGYPAWIVAYHEMKVAA